MSLKSTVGIYFKGEKIGKPELLSMLQARVCREEGVMVFAQVMKS